MERRAQRGKALPPLPHLLFRKRGEILLCVVEQQALVRDEGHRVAQYTLPLQGGQPFAQRGKAAFLRFGHASLQRREPGADVIPVGHSKLRRV